MTALASVSRRRQFITLIFRLGLALGLALLIYHIKLEYFEGYFYDLRMWARPSPPTSGAIELILIDPATVEKLHFSPGFREQTQLLERLATAQPRKILYDLDPSILRGTADEQRRFAETAAKIPFLEFITDDLEMRGETGLHPLSPPLDQLRLVSGPKSTDTTNFAKDGVTRRFLIRYQDRPTVQLEAAALFRPEALEAGGVRGQFDFLGTQQAYVNFRPPHSYGATSFYDVLNDPLSPKKFRDRIVIVGRDTQMSEKDYALTPYSREAASMTSAEVHANIIDTLIRNDSVIKTPRSLNAALLALISLLTVWVVFAGQPIRGLTILGSTVIIYLGVCTFVFWPIGYSMPVAHPLLTVFLCYYFFIPYRLIIESRRSWEMSQKHDLLQQLERLKTNFISMMSHDLKTPIARILGMSDIIQRESPIALAPAQKDALQTIRSSSEDLLRSINSILQYGRIEAQQIELNLSARDVNTVLEEVLQEHEFLARLKGIQLVKEFEPLFPSPMDPRLMRQVFSNLVENAIKYSGDGKKILISSEEANGNLVVQVADQGPGIASDELQNIFMKFYRSKNVRSSPAKGSGLGLYLAKYFTELHGGTLSVESSYGQGSTFTVELPLGHLLDPDRRTIESHRA